MGENRIKLLVDFMNSSKNGLRLNCKGTLDDLSRQNIELEGGMKLLIWDDDLDEEDRPEFVCVEAVARYDLTEAVWVAVFDWNDIKHKSILENNYCTILSPNNMEISEIVTEEDIKQLKKDIFEELRRNRLFGAKAPLKKEWLKVMRSCSLLFI